MEKPTAGPNCKDCTLPRVKWQVLCMKAVNMIINCKLLTPKLHVLKPNRKTP